MKQDRDWARHLRPRRRFDQRPQEPQTRINEAIRVPQVRLIDSDGAQIGIKSTDEAMKYAWDKNLDLVEVAPDAKPPVCRVMDYSKYKYEQEQKAKLARKHQSTITIKEIKLRPKIDPHDYATKKGHVMRFLKNRDKVKVTIMFRGPRDDASGARTGAPHEARGGGRRISASSSPSRCRTAATW